MVCSIMPMAVPIFLPRTVPVTFGTQGLFARRAEEAGFSSVILIEPPVDVAANSPDYDSSLIPVPRRIRAGQRPAARGRIWGLAHELKLEGLLAACDSRR